METAHGVVLIGAQTFRRVNLLMRERVDSFTIVLQPGGLLSLFGVPGSALTDEHFEAESALGRTVRALYERLGEVRSFPERAGVANEWLAGTLAPARSASVIRQAASHILARRGCVRIAEIWEPTGLSLRQFERRFRYEIGITPKLYARIARFEAALRRRSLRPGGRWTDIAHDLGYHDQMHMVHDFQALSGASPTGIERQLDMFVKPEVTFGASR